MKTNNRPGLARYIFLAVLFIAIITAVLLVAILQKKKGTEVYARMQKASLPIISLSLPEGFETDLHGYVKEMNLLDMRDVIVPLSSEKSLNLTVRPCGSSVTSLAYEVRDLKGETLIDSGNIANVDQSKDTEITLKFSELIESGTEYHLVLTLSFSDRSPVRYYTRILYARTNYIDQLLAFVNTFSNATYNADEADFIVNYIQPTDTSSTEDFYYTTIHSKYAMFTFSGTEVKRLPGVKVRITEMEPTQLSVTLEYSIVLDPQDSERTCDVREFFCTRSRSQKVYLLDYYRTVEQRFEADTSTAEKGRIILGVGDGQNQIINSANDVHTVFVDNREIRSYNAKTNAMNLIFSFEDDTDDTGRSSFDHHDMRIVKVTNEGDVDYMVYGYMNRGVFEGQVGICFYRYQAAENATKRLFFMPVAQSEQMLMMDLGTLAYVNDADVCYLRYGDGIYSIDLNTGESVEVSIRAYPGMYAMNERGNVVAWQEGDDLNYPERLVILNMDTQTTAVVTAEEGEFVKILDFIGDDIIYGYGSEKDSIIQANVDTQQLLKRLLIASTEEKLNVRQTYEASGFFILDAQVFEKRVTIARCLRESGRSYIRLEDDHLLLTQPYEQDENRSSLSKRNTDRVKREYYIQIGTVTNHDSQFSEAMPGFDKEANVNVIGLTHMQTGVYYVYGYGKLLAVESEINKAIDEAYNVMGVVVDEELNYLWTRGTRDLAKTISIQRYTADDEVTSLGASLQVLCAQEGIQLRTVQTDLEKGLSPFAIIDNALGSGSSVKLYNCTLQEVLYFINKGRPVLAILGDDSACVIYGYETDGVKVYFPDTGEDTQVGMNAAETYFARNNNSFISYK